MKRFFIPLSFALLCAAPVGAQTVPAGPVDSAVVSLDCLLGTRSLEWKGLGLSDEQVAEVQAVQTGCESECVTFKKTGSTDPAVSRAILLEHQERIREVLSKEQFEQWIALCRTRPKKT